MKIWQQPEPRTFRHHDWHPEYYDHYPDPDLWKRLEIVEAATIAYRNDYDFADSRNNSWADWFVIWLADLPDTLMPDWVYEFVCSAAWNLQKWCYLCKAVICIWFDLQIGQGENTVSPIASYDSYYCGHYDAPPWSRSWSEVAIGEGMFNWYWTAYTESNY